MTQLLRCGALATQRDTVLGSTPKCRAVCLTDHPERTLFTASMRTLGMCGFVVYAIYISSYFLQGVAKVLNHYKGLTS